MAMRTDTVRAKVSHETKVGAEFVLNNLGLTMSEAINLMLVQVNLQKGLPFEVKIPEVPNEATKKILDETDKGIGLVSCKDVDDLFDQLGI